MTPTEAHDWLFQRGWVIISDLYEMPEKHARMLVGKLIKAGGEQLAQRAVMGIQDKKPLEPLPWALAGIRAIQAKQAKLSRPGYRPPVLPAPVAFKDRVDPAKLARLRQELEEM